MLGGNKNGVKIYYHADCNLSLLKEKQLQSSVMAARDMHMHKTYMKRCRCNRWTYIQELKLCKSRSSGLKVIHSRCCKTGDVVMILIPTKISRNLQTRRRTKSGTWKHANVCTWFSIHFDRS